MNRDISTIGNPNDERYGPGIRMITDGLLVYENNQWPKLSQSLETRYWRAFIFYKILNMMITSVGGMADKI